MAKTPGIHIAAIAITLPLLFIFQVSASASDTNAQSTQPPPLPYELNGIASDDVTQNSHPGDYNGRWVGTWYGADGRTYHGDYQGRFSGPVTQKDQQPAPATPPQKATKSVTAPHSGTPAGSPPPTFNRPPPDPALIGTGAISNGWYYPPAIVTTTVTERTPTQR